MLATVLRVVLAMALQLKAILAVVRLCSHRAQSIEVFSQYEEVGLACLSSMMFVLARIQVIAGKIS
jgi:hypothetical protein